MPTYQIPTDPPREIECPGTKHIPEMSFGLAQNETREELEEFGFVFVPPPPPPTAEQVEAARLAMMVDGITAEIAELAAECHVIMGRIGGEELPQDRGQARAAVRAAMVGKTDAEALQLLADAVELSDLRTDIGEIGGTWEQVLYLAQS